MRFEVVHHWGACSTLLLHQLEYPSEKVWVTKLRDAIAWAEDPQTKALLPEFWSMGLERPMQSGAHDHNREVQVLRDHPISSFAFIIMTTYEAPSGGSAVYFKNVGFEGSKPQHNKKNDTTIQLWTAHVPVFLEELRRRMDFYALEYSHLKSYGKHAKKTHQRDDVEYY